jgi:hypothetical protein
MATAEKSGLARGPCGKFPNNTKKHNFVAKFGEKAVDRVPSFM